MAWAIALVFVFACLGSFLLGAYLAALKTMETLDAIAGFPLCEKTLAYGADRKARRSL